MKEAISSLDNLQSGDLAAMDIKQTIRSFIVENFMLGEEGALEPSQSLLKTGIVDSTGIMELVMFLEEKWGIQVDDKEMLPENLDSIDSIARFLECKLATPQLVS